MEWYSALPGAARWEYVVRLAAGQGHQALLAWSERTDGLHVAEGTNQWHQLQHQLRDALSAAHQRRIQQVAGQANFRVQRPAGIDYCVQLHNTQGGVECNWREGAVLAGAGLDYRRSAPLSERPNPANAVLVEQSPGESGAGTRQQSCAMGRRLHVHGPCAGTASVPGES